MMNVMSLWCGFSSFSYPNVNVDHFYSFTKFTYTHFKLLIFIKAMKLLPESVMKSKYTNTLSLSINGIFIVNSTFVKMLHK